MTTSLQITSGADHAIQAELAVYAVQRSNGDCIGAEMGAAGMELLADPGNVAFLQTS